LTPLPFRAHDANSYVENLRIERVEKASGKARDASRVGT
jgi:hypothetical protein